MKTMNIKGKDYVPVSERVLEFHRLYPEGTIQTAVSYDGNYVRCRAVVCPDTTKPTRSFSGHAEEDRTQGNINKTNATENAETGAVGRALGLMGIGIIDGIASADEVAGAEHKAETAQQVPARQPTQAQIGSKPCAKCGKSFVPKFEWATDCYSCYKAAKDGEQAPPRGDAFDQVMEAPF